MFNKQMNLIILQVTNIIFGIICYISTKTYLDEITDNKIVKFPILLIIVLAIVNSFYTNRIFFIMSKSRDQ